MPVFPSWLDVRIDGDRGDLAFFSVISTVDGEKTQDEFESVLLIMSSKSTYSRFAAASLISAALCLPVTLRADTPAKQADAQPNPPATPAKSPHHTHHVAKKPSPPPLPSGPRGPVPQIPLDAMPAVAPEVTFQDGMLTISAPNSTLGDILRGVRKQTSADIDVPASASERVATHLGPAPPREVMADLLNGSHFNYILLGSPQNSNALVRVVLVAKTGPDNPEPQAPAQANGAATPQPAKAEPDTAEAADTVDESADQAATDADETPSDEPGVKTPQQMLQEMQQRQLQQQQQNSNGQQAPGYPPPGGVMPQRPPMNPQTPQPPPQD